MGLISKTAIVKWNPKNKEYYENKGYTYTKWKDEFKVKVEDLSDSSQSFVKVKCDKCEKVFNVVWYAYKKYVKSDDKYFCVECVGKQKINVRKILKNYNESFKYWCEKNNRQDLLNRWDYKLNKCSPDEVSFSAVGINKKGYWFKCPRDIHESELFTLPSIISKNNYQVTCSKCNSFAQKLIDEYGENALDIYWSKINKINPWNITAFTKVKVYINCIKTLYHDYYLVSGEDFWASNCRCPYCRGLKVHKFDSLGYLYPEVFQIWSDKNKKSPYEYTPMSNKKVWWKCFDEKHKDYQRSIDKSNIFNFRCPECVRERHESFLQEKVRTYIEEKYPQYKLNHEYKCTLIPQNPKIKTKSGELSKNGRMPFDNEIEDLKLLIEVHGKGHYSIDPYKWNWKEKELTAEESLYKRQLYDRYKKYIAYIKGYEYLVIPYWTENDESYKKLIDNKILNIKSRN